MSPRSSRTSEEASIPSSSPPWIELDRQQVRDPDFAPEPRGARASRAERDGHAGRRTRRGALRQGHRAIAARGGGAHRRGSEGVVGSGVGRREGRDPAADHGQHCHARAEAMAHAFGSGWIIHTDTGSTSPTASSAWRLRERACPRSRSRPARSDGTRRRSSTTAPSTYATSRNG